MYGSTEQQRLFARLMQEAGARAEEMLASPAQDAGVRAIADDGFSQIERLEQSPLAEDQLTALALRLAGERREGDGLEAVLARHFDTPALSFAVEAQRRATWRGMEGGGLPLDRAATMVAALERGLSGREGNLDQALRTHAALYSSLWCDPRLGASPAARRVMLAMVTVLHEREVTPRFVAANARSRT